MTLPVRPMRAGDVPVACALLNQIIALGGTTAIETPLTEAMFAEAFLNGPNVICCHVVLDGQGVVAGFQGLARYDTLPPECGDIATFTRRTDPVKGAGRALFAATRDVARVVGLHQINATIRADNVPGLGYYAAIGFHDHAVTPAVPLTDGTPVDRLSRRYRLNPAHTEELPC